jgi:hypothetical protein
MISRLSQGLEDELKVALSKVRLRFVQAIGCTGLSWSRVS